MKKLLIRIQSVSRVLKELLGIGIYICMASVGIALIWLSMIPFLPDAWQRRLERSALWLTGLWLPVMLVETLLGLPSTFDD